MTELFRELLDMGGREKEATITASTMQQGLRRHGLHDFISPTTDLVDRTTFTEMACDEIDKMKTKIYKLEAISPRTTSLTTEPQSSPSSAHIMMPTSGPPTPNGVGGPTPPLVLRGSEEEWKTKKPTIGPPIPNGVGDPTPPPAQRGREEEGKKEGGSQAGSSKESTRRSHTSWELRMLDPSENPPLKRTRRPTRGIDTTDNSCAATRESSMICPIKCGCRNSLLDIREKTREPHGKCWRTN